jgi:8-hydroxy-5-deazaflavin:NADPH oxidoreductase
MKIAVLGMGNIGGTIGRKWAAAGHDVVFGVRDPANASREDAGNGSIDAVAHAVDSAEAVLFAVPGGALGGVLAENAAALDGKLLIDAANNIGGSGPTHQLPLFEQHVPAANVFRAFNSLGWENFANPQFGSERADLFYSGPDGPSRATIERLIEEIGLHPIYVGDGTVGADTVDHVLRLWFALAIGQKRGRHLAFRVLDDSAGSDPHDTTPKSDHSLAFRASSSRLHGGVFVDRKRIKLAAFQDTCRSAHPTGLSPSLRQSAKRSM